ncbi:MAG TPA: hypothetical protein VF799_08800, partial [Geobacteraceae bacterium]
MLSPYPITEVDMDGRVSFANPATRRLFPDLEQLGSSHPWLADWETLAAACREKGTKPDDREVVVAGHWYRQAMYYVPEERRLRIYGFDITKRKQAEEALNRLNEELELRVKQRTAELGEKNAELYKLNRIFVGRELRMAELKEKIRKLEKQDGSVEKAAEPDA